MAKHFVLLSARDGQLIRSTIKPRVAIELWKPGTWLGQGDTEQDAMDDANRQYQRHLKIAGPYRRLSGHF
jgi:hypothetical protein